MAISKILEDTQRAISTADHYIDKGRDVLIVQKKIILDEYAALSSLPQDEDTSAELKVSYNLIESKLKGL